MGEALSNKQSATRRGLSETTVKTHVSHLMRKYGTTSRLKLVVAVHREREAALEAPRAARGLPLRDPSPGSSSVGGQGGDRCDGGGPAGGSQ